MKKKMKINGLFIFSLVLGTFSLGLNRTKSRAVLTENATLPSVDTAKRNTSTYPDSNINGYGVESALQTADIRENGKEENLSKDVNFEDERTDSSEITTISPHSSYFARFITEGNAACNSEIYSDISESKSEDNSYCTEKIDETITESETEIITEKSLNVTAGEEATEIPAEYENTQEKVADDTPVESTSEQDIDTPTLFHPDVKRVSLNNEKDSHEATPEKDKMPTSETRTVPPLDLDEYDYYQYRNELESPNLATRLFHRISDLFSTIPGASSILTRKFFK